MSLEMREWYYKRCKGMLSSFVATADRRPETLSKSIATTISRGNLARAEVDRILIEIEHDTQAFVRAQWSDPAARLERLGTIKAALR